MNLFFENMKWLRGSSSSGRGVEEKVVVEVMTILMMVMMILIMMVILMILMIILMMVMMILKMMMILIILMMILMIILMMVMMTLYLPSHASKVMRNPLPDKVADLVETSISLILMVMKIYHIILCFYGHIRGIIKHKQHNLIYC